VARQDRVVFSSRDTIGTRKDLNGILLLDSALQASVAKPDDIVRIELPLPEVSVFLLLFSYEIGNCSEIIGHYYLQTVIECICNSTTACRVQTVGPCLPLSA